MTLLAAALLLAQSRVKVDAPTLEYYQDQFVVRTAKSVWFVPVKGLKPTPKMLVAFRRNEDYAVWDERGLTVRHGDRTRTSRLEEVVASDRLFNREEIGENLRLVKAGQRQRGASALSGAIRYGRDAYFLLRWEDSKRKPWAEFLVRVALEGRDLWPRVVGRFEGLSLGYKPIDDRLFILGDAIAAVTRQDKVWGVSTYDPKRQQFAFRAVGDELRSFMPTGRKTALYVERTAYDLIQAGRIDMGFGERAPLFESRANARFLDTERPYVVISSSTAGARIFNAESGAEFALPQDNGVGRAGPYVVVWSPYESPTTATVFSPDRWQPVARWTLPNTSTSQRPTPNAQHPNT